jgi:TetR/AcrR family tetracycline transcriptional repressor
MTPPNDFDSASARDSGARPIQRAPASTARRVALSRELIVTETLALVDEQGIAAASMRSVGDRLHVRAMSLYRHFGSREELFDGVVERIVDELSNDPDVPESQRDIGWREYLDRLARGVRRYARAHPHAFPLVATRPPEAPWVNPPLRSLRWIESMLANLAEAGFTDDQVLFTYRTVNSFLLGYLLLETSAMVIDDPKPGDGSFQTGDDTGDHDPVDPADAVPGSISPTRTTGDRETITAADSSEQLINATDNVSEREYPMIHRLRDGLTENRFEEEFSAGLHILLARIADQLTET